MSFCHRILQLLNNLQYIMYINMIWNIFVSSIYKAYIIQWKKWFVTSWLHLQQIWQLNKNQLNQKTKTFYLAHVNKHHSSRLSK